MKIEKFESNSKYNIFTANISLNYDELQRLNNILYEVCDGNAVSEEWKTDKVALTLYRNFGFLFDIVKNGCVDDWTFKHANSISEKINNLK